MIEVVIVGAPPELAELLQQELRKMGRDDIQIANSSAPGVTEALNRIVDDSCECPLCAGTALAQAEGRSPFVHPDTKLDAEGYVQDKIRHRLFKSPNGDVLFFDNLFHPMDQMNMFTLECERGAQDIYGVKPLLDSDGDQIWQTMDWSDGKREVDLDHVGCQIENMASRQTASVSMISGPTYETKKAERAANG